MTPIPDTGAVLHDYFAQVGARGGKSKSKAKLNAVRQNLAKARARRWKKGRSAAKNGRMAKPVG